MKRVIPFNKFRYAAYILSLIIITGGIGGTLLFKGYNVGVDFKGGLSQQIRIAPAAFRVTNVGNRVIDFELADTEVSYIRAGDPKLVWPRPQGQPLPELVKNLESERDLKVEVEPGADAYAALLLPAKGKLDLNKQLVVNRRLPPGTKPEATIETLRALLVDIPGGVNIQEVGDPANQDFILRSDPTASKIAKADIPEGKTDSDLVAEKVIANLEKRFGAGSVIEKQREALGPQMALTLASGSLIAIAVALILMLAYVSFRFRINYATAAVIALIHDALTTMAFVGIFQVELNTAVVAAVLTIIGYSINDTIVIYDRIRENEKLQKGLDLGRIMDMSVTQTLGRTFITSFTVFLAIFPLYLFGTGPVKDFSFSLIFGLITGTYSTIFIASPIALSWQRALDKAKRKKEIKLYGKVQTPELEARPVEAEQPQAEAMAEAESGALEGAVALPEAPAPETPSYLGTGTGPVTRVQRVLEKKKKRHHL